MHTLIPTRATALAALAAMLAVATSSAALAAQPAAPLAEGGVEAEVAAQVQQSLPPGLALVELKLQRALSPRAGAEVTIRWAAPPRAGRASVLVVQRSGEQELSRTWAQVELRAPRRVVVADRDLRAGTTLAVADLVDEDRPVAFGEGLELDAASLAGLSLRHPVAAGAVLRDSDVNLPAPAAVGTPVHIVVRRGGVTIATPGQIERPLLLGQTGYARSFALGRQLRGRLTGRDTFVVDTAAGATP